MSLLNGIGHLPPSDTLAEMFSTEFHSLPFSAQTAHLPVRKHFPCEASTRQNIQHTPFTEARNAQGY